MVVDSTMNTLPSGPAALSFNKDEFMKNDFNVDQFVVECRRRVPLETLRDDLNIYLKILQTAMIELINKDYADFVNLSTNLVGLDKAINTLTTPLCQLRDEVQSVRESLNEAAGAVEQQLQRQSQIRNKKTCMQRLLNILNSVDKIEKLLGIKSEDGISQRWESTGPLIERVATEFNKLQFHVNKSRGLPLVEQIKPRIASITSSLQYNLEGSLVEGLENKNVTILRQCLRTYATIDKIRDAEALFRQHIVKPYMEDAISEYFLTNNSQGLSGMYKKVLEFIPVECKPLREALQPSAVDGEVVQGYDFLINAVWPEIVSNIEARTPSIFAPGNPTIFHNRYSVTVDFLNQFEHMCGSQASVQRLRDHSSYSTFMSHWSLPVYFQIRFQEIAGSLESALMTPFNKTSTDSEFSLLASESLWSCIKQCWLKDIILPPLTHRFWKLTIQLLSRYSSWMIDIKETQLCGKTSNSSNGELVQTDVDDATAIRHNHSSPDLAHLSTTDGKKINFSIDGSDRTPENNLITLTQVVCMIIDAHNIYEKLNHYYDHTVSLYLEQIGLTDHIHMKSSIADSKSAIESHLPKFGQFVTSEIIGLCSVHLKLVADIPRLYRRTNREVPTKASGYVDSMMQPLKDFLNEHKHILSQERREEWASVVIDDLSEQYLTITSDVLISVRRMADGLKRLKKARKSDAVSTSGMSDDDKIRLQLWLDVTSFGKLINQMLHTLPERFTKLQELVTAAKMGQVIESDDQQQVTGVPLSHRRSKTVPNIIGTIEQ